MTTNVAPRTATFVNGCISSSSQSWLNRNMKSLDVRGAPSDHFIPGRRRIVVTRPSSLTLQDSARLGRMLRRSAEIVSACFPVEKVPDIPEGDPRLAAVLADALVGMADDRIVWQAVPDRRKVPAIQVRALGKTCDVEFARGLRRGRTTPAAYLLRGVPPRAALSCEGHPRAAFLCEGHPRAAGLKAVFFRGVAPSRSPAEGSLLARGAPSRSHG